MRDHDTLQRPDVRPGTSKEAIGYHYDIDSQFYRLWLGESMTYSCALWQRDSDSLEDAQERKIDYLLDQARAAGCARMLEVGCGWGPIVQRAVNDHGVGRAVGLTLSESQAHFVRGLNDPRLDVRVESWADHEPESPYDTIVVAGTLEHFATRDQSEDEKEQTYRRFLVRCHEWLRPGASMCIQCIAYGRMTRADINPFIADEIFPESDLPTLAQLARATELLFQVELVKNDAAHYKRTCAEWLRRLHLHREEAVGLVGEKVVDRYERYLSLSCRIFEVGASVLYRITLRRLGRS